MKSTIMRWKEVHEWKELFIKSDMPQAGFETAQNLFSEFVK